MLRNVGAATCHFMGSFDTEISVGKLELHDLAEIAKSLVFDLTFVTSLVTPSQRNLYSLKKNTPWLYVGENGVARPLKEVWL